MPLHDFNRAGFAEFFIPSIEIFCDAVGISHKDIAGLELNRTDAASTVGCNAER